MNSTTLFLLFPRYARRRRRVGLSSSIIWRILSVLLLFVFYFLPFFLLFFLRDELLSSQKFQPCTTTPFASRRRTTMAEASDRGGFSRGFGRGGDRGDRRGRGGDRGGRGRGGRGRGRGKEDKDVWTPCTKLGRLVQAVRVRSIRCFCRRRGCALAEWTRLFRESVSRRRDGVCDALSRSRRLRRARFPFLSFVFRIDFGPTGGLFWGSTSLSICRSAHVHANGMCSPMSLLFVVEFIQGKIKSLEQIYLHSIPIKEYQIVDYFVGANLVDEVMKIAAVQKQTSAVIACDSKRS